MCGACLLGQVDLSVDRSDAPVMVQLSHHVSKASVSPVGTCKDKKNLVVLAVPGRKKGEGRQNRRQFHRCEANVQT